MSLMPNQGLRCRTDFPVEYCSLGGCSQAANIIAEQAKLIEDLRNVLRLARELTIAGGEASPAEVRAAIDAVDAGELDRQPLWAENHNLRERNEKLRKFLIKYTTTISRVLGGWEAERSELLGLPHE